MNLPAFLLDRWIEQKHSADPPIEFDLASSTGPVWTLRELLALSNENELEKLLDSRLTYTSAAGSPELRAAIAALEGANDSDVQIVTGASEALLILFFLAAEPGANVVLPQPGFPASDALAASLGIEIRSYTLRARNRFRVDLGEIRSLVNRDTRLLLINSPHNPTGTVLSDEEIENLHDFCADRRIPFVVNQVYHPIYHGQETRSAARLPHATVLGDFSKALCLSGLRLGWIIERDPIRRDRFRNARNHFTITGNSLGERLAVIAMKNSDRIYDRARSVSRKNLALLDEVLAPYDGFLQWLKPAGGMTAFPWLVDGSDAREFCRRLMKQGVLIVPGDCFSQPAHFRLGFAASGERFPMAMERLADSLEMESRQLQR